MLPAIFHKLEQKNLKICMGTQKTSNSQSSLEKEEWSWRNQPSWLQIYSHQDSMVLAQKQKYGPMEQDKMPVNKPMYLCISFPDKGGKNMQWDRQPLQ